jgi:uncharacterized protein
MPEKQTIRCILPMLLACFFAMAGPASASPLVQEARLQVGVTISYDSAYRKLPYPGGDVPMSAGVCTDVLIRAFRGLGLDLQEAVHNDMKRGFDQYPRDWGLKGPDPNIDHRRVLNLMTYFKRLGWERERRTRSAEFKAGDIAAWNLSGGATHIGIISDRRNEAGIPLVIHNIGWGAREEDILFSFRMIGHYRPKLDAPPFSAPGKAPIHRRP